MFPRAMKVHMRGFSSALAAVLCISCGSMVRPHDGNGGGGGGGGNGNDGGDGGSANCATNCDDPACSGIDGCPVCGMVDEPQSTPIALPDTNQGNKNKTCTSDAQCTSSSAPNCVVTADTADGGPGYCAQSYVDTLNFVGFGSGATLTDTSKLISVCATIEHSWLGDLQIELISPDGKTVALRQFIGRDLDAYFLGHPDFCGSDGNPLAGSGYKYCWTEAASTKFLTSDNSNCAASGGCEQWDGTPNNNSCQDSDGDDFAPYAVVPAGSYLPDVGFSALQGAQLNGKWTFRVTDLWAIDYGFLFDWSIQWDPSLIGNCGSAIIQ